MAELDATRACVVCGVLFPRDGKRTLCSDKCRADRLNAQMRERRAERAPLLTCKHCSKEFKGSNGRQYCGGACKERLRRAREVEERREYFRKHRASDAGKACRARRNLVRNVTRTTVGRDRTPDRIRRQRVRAACRALSHRQIQAIKHERCDCLYCGVSLTDSEKIMDHMDPLSKGGAHDQSNLVVACAACNLRKSARPFGAWVAMIDESRRAMVVAVYEKKRRAPSCQPSLFAAIAA